MSANKADQDDKPVLNTCYQVNGFRSLIDFELTLHPGMNVLVGPNGAGKTNFIEFLDFMGTLIWSGCTNAVSGAGGIARVFSQERVKKTYSKLNATIKGMAETFEPAVAGQRNHQFFRYEYEIEIKFSKTHSAIFISKELLRINKLHKESELGVSSTHVGTIFVTRASPDDNGIPKWSIGPRLFSRNLRNPFHLTPAHASKGSAEEYLSALRDRILNTPVEADRSFLSSIPGIPALDGVARSITMGRSYNISPERARKADDISTPPGIDADGTGLSSTLYFLSKLRKDKENKTRRTFFRARNMRRANSDSLDMILVWTRLVFPELHDISATPDPHSGKYLVNMIVSEERSLKISLQSASDGTLKWLCLVSLVIASGGMFSLEEPENFLHPRMQQYLIEMIREALEGEPPTNYFIFSTHSETLINQCTPEELVLFTFENNKTSCSRIKNPGMVEEEINKTGFGLGHYYASNALS